MVESRLQKAGVKGKKALNGRYEAMQGALGTANKKTYNRNAESEKWHQGKENAVGAGAGHHASFVPTIGLINGVKVAPNGAANALTATIGLRQPVPLWVWIRGVLLKQCDSLRCQADRLLNARHRQGEAKGRFPAGTPPDSLCPRCRSR